MKTNIIMHSLVVHSCMNVAVTAEKQWQSLIKDKIAVGSNPFSQKQIIIFNFHSQLNIFYSDSMLFIFTCIVKIRTSTQHVKTGEWIDVLIFI